MNTVVVPQRTGALGTELVGVTISLDAVYQKLTDILRDVFDDDTLVARPELTAPEVDGWDSFAHLRLIFTVEKAFGVNFAASQISALRNVGELAELICSRIDAKAGV